MLSDASSRVFRRDQRNVNQMLAQEPRLKLVCAQDFADEKMVAEFSRSYNQLASSANNDLVRIQQSGELYGNLFPPAGRPFDLRGLGHVRRHSDADAAQIAT